jgi:hypothetical protein
LRSTYLSFALKGLKLERVRFVRQTSQVLDGLPAGDDPDVVHGDQGIQESLEPDLVVRLSEPRGVVKKTERGSENTHV